MCAITWLPITSIEKGEFVLLEEKMRLRGTCSFGYIEDLSSLLHSRFQTNGTKECSQPFFINSNATCFNGQLFDWKAGEREGLETKLQGQTFSSIDQYPFKEIGSFSMVMSFTEGVFGLKDPYSRRPLYLVRVSAKYFLTSEPHILCHREIEKVEELRAGEWIKLTHGGLIHSRGMTQALEKKCLLELAYFMNGDTVVSGHTLSESRKELGRRLSKKLLGNGGVVIPIPSGANDFALGVAESLGLDISFSICRNKTRTFISKMDRNESIRDKYQILGEVPDRVILVDDSIVSGETLKHIISLLRTHGASEITLAIGSPKIKNICNLGMGFIFREDILFYEEDNFLSAYDCHFLDISDYEEVFQANFCQECLN